MSTEATEVPPDHGQPRLAPVKELGSSAALSIVTSPVHNPTFQHSMPGARDAQGVSPMTFFFMELLGLNGEAETNDAGKWGDLVQSTLNGARIDGIASCRIDCIRDGMPFFRRKRDR